MFSICFLEAISGTTPPYNVCKSICEDMKSKVTHIRNLTVQTLHSTGFKSLII